MENNKIWPHERPNVINNFPQNWSGINVAQIKMETYNMFLF
jgi:hypothetical protein